MEKCCFYKSSKLLIMKTSLNYIVFVKFERYDYFIKSTHILKILSENSSELMLFVNLNRHEIKFLVSCIL